MAIPLGTFSKPLNVDFQTVKRLRGSNKLSEGLDKFTEDFVHEKSRGSTDFPPEGPVSVRLATRLFPENNKQVSISVSLIRQVKALHQAV